jgi:hypothetical protein
MKNFLITLMLSYALMAVAVTTGHTEQSVSAGVTRQEPESLQPSAQQDARTRPPEDAETQDALAFTGWLVKVKGRILLKDPVTKMNYQLDDALKAKRFIGKQVKVIGKLNLNSNMIYVESIGPSL